MKSRLRSALVVAITAALSPLATGTASSVDLPSACYNTNLKIFISSKISAAAQQNIKDGAMFWSNKANNWSGNGGAIPVSFTTDAAAANARVAYDSLLTDGTFGVGICKAKTVSLNPTYATRFAATDGWAERWVAHELGHVLGLGHVGANDSYDTKVPIMSTCRDDGVFSQDDAIGANSLTDQVSGYFNATANNSFENGARYWGQSSVTTAVSTGGVDGSRTRLHVAATSSNGSIYSTSRLMDLQGHTLDHIKGRANFRLLSSYDSGTITVRVEVSKFTYPDGETCGYPDVTGYNGKEKKINSGPRQFLSSYALVKTCRASLSWALCDTPGVNPGGADGFDVRVSLFPNVTLRGARTPVGVDRLRVMADYS